MTADRAARNAIGDHESAAGTIEQLIVFLLLAGLGRGGPMPNAIALTTEFASKRNRSRLATILVCFFSLGAAIGGFVAAAVIPTLGWRAVFWIGGLAPLAIVPLMIMRLPGSVRFLSLRGGRNKEACPDEDGDGSASMGEEKLGRRPGSAEASDKACATASLDGPCAVARLHAGRDEGTAARHEQRNSRK